MQDKLYDDFIPDFNPKKFDAAQWIDLFATAGAKYFVLVTVGSFLDVDCALFYDARNAIETP